jgi:hypothetical protein
MSREQDERILGTADFVAAGERSDAQRGQPMREDALVERTTDDRACREHPQDEPLAALRRYRSFFQRLPSL